MAHLLGRYCLDFGFHLEPEAMAHLRGRYCLDFGSHPEPEAMAHLVGGCCLDVEDVGPMVRAANTV
jgi:hypothetical protein